MRNKISGNVFRKRDNLTHIKHSLCLNLAWAKFNQSSNSESSKVARFHMWQTEIPNGSFNVHLKCMRIRVHRTIAPSHRSSGPIDDYIYYRVCCLIKVVGIIIRRWNIKRIHTQTIPFEWANVWVCVFTKIDDDKNHCTKTTIVFHGHSHLWPHSTYKDTSLSWYCVCALSKKRQRLVL